MAYESLSIKDLINGINNNDYYLPAIQRKFVWKEDKICDLFNSIMRSYPIGTFLFWELTKQKAKDYTFYEFLKNYHQRDSKNKVVNNDFSHDIKGVLDGQQRISSMYIALQGIYQTKRKYARKSTNNAYEERLLYLDLAAKKGEYDFNFLKEDVAKNQKGKCNYLVRDALYIEGESSNEKTYEAIIEKLKLSNPENTALIERKEQIIKERLELLVSKINDTKLISYFNIAHKELDEILDIFVRVNSGGLILSKSDLLFSTLVAHWEDGRKHIESLIEKMNGVDEKFKFGTDFLMRTCLFLIDAPMNFKIKTFDSTNIHKIKDNWEKISDSLLRSVSLLREFGFDHTRLSSNYALTPVAYYLMKGGTVNNSTQRELKKLITHGLLKQIYSGQADNTLRVLRDCMRIKVPSSKGEYKLVNLKFSFSDLIDIKLPAGKRISITRSDITDFLTLKKGNQTFLLLSVLYPHFKVDQIDFDQDHMHPQSKFNAKNLKRLGLDEEEIDSWRDMKDQLPNLQFLKGIDNNDKRAKPLKTWIADLEEDEETYRKENYIPKTQSLAFEEFKIFFESRKNLLEKKLIKEFIQ